VLVEHRLSREDYAKCGLRQNGYTFNFLHSFMGTRFLDESNSALNFNRGRKLHDDYHLTISDLNIEIFRKKHE
jgi:hypothetical protein